MLYSCILNYMYDYNTIFSLLSPSVRLCDCIYLWSSVSTVLVTICFTFMRNTCTHTHAHVHTNVFNHTSWTWVWLKMHTYAAVNVHLNSPVYRGIFQRRMVWRFIDSLALLLDPDMMSGRLEQVNRYLKLLDNRS